MKSRMKMFYSFPPIPEREQEQLVSVFLDELERQNWFAVAFFNFFGTEAFLFTQ